MQLLYFWLIFSAGDTSPEILGQVWGTCICKELTSGSKVIFTLKAIIMYYYFLPFLHYERASKLQPREGANQWLIVCLIVKLITTENFSHKIKILIKVTSVRKHYKAYDSSVQLHISSTNNNHLFFQRLSTFQFFLIGWKTFTNCVCCECCQLINEKQFS